MKTNGFVVLSILLLCVMVSCTSAGSGRLSSSSISASSKRVHLVPNTEERATEYMPDVTAALRKAGFTVVSDRSAPYEVAVTFAGGGFDLTCSIVMNERGVPVVSGKGVNNGFGTWMVRDQAYRGVFEAALKEFSGRIGAL